MRAHKGDQQNQPVKETPSRRHIGVRTLVAVPAEAIHLTALREAMLSPRMDAPARRRFLRQEDAVRLGATVVDLPYFDRFEEEVVRYLVLAPARPSPWGQRLHEQGPIELLAALVRHGRRDEEAAAVALGLASHVVVDRALHPLINALATARMAVDRADHGTLHREVEKFQSVCFHEDYAGGDAMGTPGMRRFIEVTPAGTLDRAPIGRVLVTALHEAYGEAPTVDVLARWGRGYRSYVRLIASPLGKIMAPPSAKAWGRPTYTRGPWGDFPVLLGQAIELSIAVVNATAAALECDDRALDDALAGLLARVPAGTIDDLGTGVDLSRPYVPALPT
jgi:hypothetical protein